MSGASLRLSVVICAYTRERWADICESVTSVAAQSVAAHETIVVIDHNPALLALARAGLGPAVVVASEGPPGLSGARNTGWARAAGDVVAFLDDDAAADPDWARQLLAAYEDEDVVGVGGGVLPRWRAARPPWFPDEFLWVVGCSYRGQPATRSVVRNGIGANMSFRRSVLVEAGGFDVDLGRRGGDAAGCEETELSIRAAALRPSARILLEPAAVVRHAVTPQRTTRAYFRRRCLAEGRSKALVSTLAGTGPALAAERAYASRVLPRGIAEGLLGLLRGDRAAGARAVAIAEGLVLTAGGYASRRVRDRISVPRSAG